MDRTRQTREEARTTEGSDPPGQRRPRTSKSGDAKFEEGAQMPETQRSTNDERLVWSIEEAGCRLGISRAHAYQLVARGDLPHLRLGRRLVVPKRALESLLADVESG